MESTIKTASNGALALYRSIMAAAESAPSEKENMPLPHVCIKPGTSSLKIKNTKERLHFTQVLIEIDTRDRGLATLKIKGTRYCRDFAEIAE